MIQLHRVNLQCAAGVLRGQQAQHKVVGIPSKNGTVFEGEEGAGGGAFDSKILSEFGSDEAFRVGTFCGGASFDGVDLVAVPEHEHALALDSDFFAST